MSEFEPVEHEDPLRDRLLVVDPPITIETFLELARSYYENHHCGGSLHIWLDEGGTEEDTVRFCLDYAEKKGDARGVLLAKLGLLLTQEERDTIESRCGGTLRPIKKGDFE